MRRLSLAKKGGICIKASELFGSLCESDAFEIKGISDNSLKIKEGYVFFAKKGEKQDGCNYCENAVKNGAVLIVSHKKISSSVPVIVCDDVNELMANTAKKFYFPNPPCFKLIGITGTNGKTTVSDITATILISSGKNVGVIGTSGVFFNRKRLDFNPSAPTTPMPLELWEIFAEMEKRRADFVVMEVSSHALTQNRVLGADFFIGAFTNLSQDHLDYHLTMDEYAKAKEKLFSICKTAVINVEDIFGRNLHSRVSCPKLSVGIHDADILASAIRLTPKGSYFTLECDGKKTDCRLALLGRFNVDNALVAAAICRASGLEPEEISNGLNAVTPVLGRMERIETNLKFEIIIDYAHTPDGLEKVIHTAKGFTKNKVITLFGCGGDRDKTKRSIMGRIAGKFSDYTIITSDNPRSENPFDIITDIYKGVSEEDDDIIIIPNRKKAIAHALELAREGDTLLICGKGHETYQIIGNDTLHFDEHEIINELIGDVKNAKIYC